jgi:hypothetical protein
LEKAAQVVNCQSGVSG